MPSGQLLRISGKRSFTNFKIDGNNDKSDNK